jgi:hypothetical protein
MADKADVLIQALRDHFASAEPQPAESEPSVIKKAGSPILIKDGQGNWQTMEPVHPEMMDTPRLPHEEQERIKADAETRQAERIAAAKRIAQVVDEEHYRVACENQLAPIGSTGRPDVSFLADLKKCFVPDEANVDWPKTYALRQLLLTGYENKKSAKPGRQLAPVPDTEIAAAMEKILNPSSAPIRNNRFVHSEKQ